MKRAILALCLFVFLVGCPVEMWIPIQTVPRPATSYEHVAFLDEMPARPFEVIGIITPPPDEYETEAAAVRAMRKIAAKHGADAIFIESKSEGSGWSFKGTKGGSFTTREIRAKAIAWTK